VTLHEERRTFVFYEGEKGRKMTTRILQLLLIAAVLAGLVIYGFICDKREHSSTAKRENDAQESLPFPSPDSPDHEHRGAAMSHL
jgi:hypothetical protein